MNKQGHRKVTFKPYDQSLCSSPMPSLESMIPPGHLVREVSQVIDKLNLDEIVSYPGGGSSTYHPKMLLKALIYGYVDQQYSSRRIEKALKENINYMWLSGLQTPDHNTISRFRSGVLKDKIKDVFSQVLLQLIEGKYVRLSNYHIDGTKIESVANRYTFVWAKQVSNQQGRLLTKIGVLLDQIEAEEDLSQLEALKNKEGQELDIARLQQLVEELNSKMEADPKENKSFKKKSKP